MREIMKKTCCENCGAEVTTEICPYCKAKTKISKKSLNLEYPLLDCDEVNINVTKTIIVFIIALLFMIFGILMLIYPDVIVGLGFKMFYVMFIFVTVIEIIGLITIYLCSIPLIKVLLLKKFGKQIEGTLLDYVNDFEGENINHQVLKLLLETEEGKNIILYQLNNDKKEYKVGSKIKLENYKKLYRIVNTKKYYFEEK